MEKLYSNIIGIPVYEDDEARPFTSVRDVVLDPEMRGKLIALVVDVNRNKVIVPIDIISWGDRVRVHSGAAIADGEDILRVAEVQKRGVRFIDAKVETEKGENLGKIYDLGIDNKTFDLRKIFVARTFLGLIRFESRIISAKNIVEVLDDKVVVKNLKGEVKEKGKLKALPRQGF